MKWNIGTKIGAGYALVFIALLLISVIAYTSINKLIDTAQWVTHTNIVLAEIRQMKSELQDVETGFRGYMLSGDEKFLTPFNDAVDQVGKGVQKLRELTKDNPNQQRRLDTIKAIAEEKISFSKKGIEFLKAKGREHSREWNYIHGKKIMDNFRVIAGEMIKEEEDLLKKREVDAKESVSTTKTTIVACAVLSLVCMIFIAVLLTRNISSPLKDLTDVAEKISNGDISTGLKTGNRGDEVGALTKSFAAMIQNLQEMANIEARCRRRSDGDGDSCVRA